MHQVRTLANCQIAAPLVVFPHPGKSAHLAINIRRWNGATIEKAATPESEKPRQGAPYSQVRPAASCAISTHSSLTRKLRKSYCLGRCVEQVSDHDRRLRLAPSTTMPFRNCMEFTGNCGSPETAWKQSRQAVSMVERFLKRSGPKTVIGSAPAVLCGGAEKLS